jgi:hypothetical protein
MDKFSGKLYKQKISKYMNLRKAEEGAQMCKKEQTEEQ